MALVPWFATSIARLRSIFEDGAFATATLDSKTSLLPSPVEIPGKPSITKPLVLANPSPFFSLCCDSPEHRPIRPDKIPASRDGEAPPFMPLRGLQPRRERAQRGTERPDQTSFKKSDIPLS